MVKLLSKIIFLPTVQQIFSIVHGEVRPEELGSRVNFKT